MNEFQKALLQSMNDEFSDVPAVQEIDTPVLTQKRKRTHTLRRTLLIAAVVFILVGSVFAAYVLTHQIGEVEIETDVKEIFDFEISESDNNRRYYQLTFKDNFANVDAPQKIEAYALPTQLVTADMLRASECYIEKADLYAYYPFADEQPLGLVLTQEEIDQIFQAPSTVHYVWYTAENVQIDFSQSLAVIATDGTAYATFAFGDSETIVPSYHKFQLDEYSIFSFELDCSKDPDFQDPTNAVLRTWYWTDGDYLYSLSCSLSEQEMIELFRSVQPVSTQFPYREGAEDRIEDNFDLLAE